MAQPSGVSLSWTSCIRSQWPLSAACNLQGAREAQEEAQAAVREGEEAVTQVQNEYRDAVAEVEKLVEERQRWQKSWDEERQRMEAEKAALAASMDVSCQMFLYCPHQASPVSSVQAAPRPAACSLWSAYVFGVYCHLLPNHIIWSSHAVQEQHAGLASVSMTGGMRRRPRRRQPRRRWSCGRMWSAS